MQPPPALVYLYGPPAAGKLTVARELQARTGLALFHNHLTVNAMTAVFEFGTPAFNEIVHRVRQDVFVTAMRNAISLIFTNNSMWRLPDGEARFLDFAEQVRADVTSAGGRCVFVRLTAPIGVLLDRVDAPSRREQDKLLDPVRLTEMLEAWPEPVVPGTLLTLDTAALRPDAAATAIEDALAQLSPSE